MLIYKNTFDNVKTGAFEFPIEDQFYATETEAIVADGITRDPIGVSDLSVCSNEEFLEKYPKPSGAELAAKTICDTFSKTNGSLMEKLIKCNESVRKLNNKYILKCDYLENDYYGAVASCINIKNNILDYAYICDCGVAVFDKNGDLIFKTDDDMEKVNKYFDTGSFTWNQPEARVIVRKNYRNKPNNEYSYGAITGESEFEYYLKEGSLKLNNSDIVIVYSDGFSNYLFDKDFYNNLISLINGDNSNFQNYLEKMGNNDYRKYGKEKTLVVMKNG